MMPAGTRDEADGSRRPESLPSERAAATDLAAGAEELTRSQSLAWILALFLTAFALIAFGTAVVGELRGKPMRPGVRTDDLCFAGSILAWGAAGLLLVRSCSRRRTLLRELPWLGPLAVTGVIGVSLCCLYFVEVLQPPPHRKRVALRWSAGLRLRHRRGGGRILGRLRLRASVEPCRRS